MKQTRLLLLCFTACLSLSACGTTNGKMTEAQMRTASIDAAAAQAASRTGEVIVKPVAVTEKLYAKNPSDPFAALDYARSLRDAKSLDKAEAVLAPFAKKKEASPATLTEYSSILLAKGDYKTAQNYASKAVAKDAQDFRAYHNLGLAYETQGLHPEAEKAFRKALDLWKGNPTTVMNNLALNLASQGYLDESIDLLRRAQTLSPEKTELERNIRIVTALQQAARGPTPKPMPKPADLRG